MTNENGNKKTSGYQVEVKKAFNQIELGVKAVFESENYKKYLKTMSKFHKYSVNNSLLIMMQCPEASIVTGASKWKNDFNRMIKKGSKAIKILIPHPYKREIEEDGVLVEKDFCYFTLGNVFDISQTEGEEFPSLCKELKGDSEEVKNLIKVLSKVSKFPIFYWNLKEDRKGFFSSSDKKIVVKKGMSDLQTFKTLAHEIAHSRLHLKTDKGNKQCEIEAESIAFVVANHFGIDTSEYSFPYIANWGKEKDSKELKSILANIQMEAKAIIEEMNAVINDKQEVAS